MKARYRRDEPILPFDERKKRGGNKTPRNIDLKPPYFADWGFSSRQKDNAMLVLTALYANTGRRKQETEAELAKVTTEIKQLEITRNIILKKRGEK